MEKIMNISTQTNENIENFKKLLLIQTTNGKKQMKT